MYHADIPVQFHAGDTLEARQLQADGNRPPAQRDMGLMHDGPRFDREVRAAVRAAVGHIVVARIVRAGAAADRTTNDLP